jgi:hypothetical protein
VTTSAGSSFGGSGRSTATLRAVRDPTVRVGSIRQAIEFITDLAQPAHRPKLWMGIWSGFGVAFALGILAAAASYFELTPWTWAYVALVGAKIATNSLAWLALMGNRWVIQTQALNTIADVIILTGAIYFTGGPYSPLLPAYVIVICVLSLLSNTGVTLLMAGFIVACFAAMIPLMATGILGPTPVPGAPGTQPSWGYTLTAIAYCALVVGVPAWFSAATLRLLRDKEVDLERRTAQLIQTATQRSQFVASMTHELRTPIHGVQGLADVIAAGVYGPVTDKQKEACASIKRSAQSLLSLVDDLLALTRAEATGRRRHRRPRRARVGIGVVGGRHQAPRARARCRAQAAAGAVGRALARARAGESVGERDQVHARGRPGQRARFRAPRARCRDTRRRGHRHRYRGRGPRRDLRAVPPEREGRHARLRRRRPRARARCASDGPPRRRGRARLRGRRGVDVPRDRPDDMARAHDDTAVAAAAPADAPTGLASISHRRLGLTPRL